MTINGTVEEILQVYNDCLTFTGKRSEFTLRATYKTWDGTLEWSTDHNTWTTLTGTEVMQSVDKKLYLRGKGNTKFYNNENHNGVEWVLSEKADCIGNIQTLLYWKNPPTSISVNSCYRYMFKGCSNLTIAPELPATTFARGCYQGMFCGCTNLTNAPILPATTLAESCYSGMFEDCTNLTNAPVLPATTLATYCYYGMFSGCTNLTTAPELPATTLVDYCYYSMFDGCTKLKVNDTSGNKIFTCPSDIPYGAVTNMFSTGTPTAGNTYYYTASMR